ncbi:hypothetical protein [Streptosporangium sp. NPDC006007]|uniref:hypothetical protein n=1 Tax=Streptosporangium sp. NPDC006007 TaxID=3154575 RepID=UPI0033B5E242
MRSAPDRTYRNHGYAQAGETAADRRDVLDRIRGTGIPPGAGDPFRPPGKARARPNSPAREPVRRAEHRGSSREQRRHPFGGRR